jgi:5'-methylthioinosine phosphorylase
VGMTGMPETALAKELELRYATIAVVANHAAGRGDSATSINMENVNATAEAAMERVRKVLECVVNCSVD